MTSSKVVNHEDENDDGTAFNSTLIFCPHLSDVGVLLRLITAFAGAAGHARVAWKNQKIINSFLTFSMTSSKSIYYHTTTVPPLTLWSNRPRLPLFLGSATAACGSNRNRHRCGSTATTSKINQRGRHQPQQHLLHHHKPPTASA